MNDALLWNIGGLLILWLVILLAVGFIESLIAIVHGVYLSLWGWAIYAIVHFAMKYW